MSEWFYYNNGKVKGPFNDNIIKKRLKFYCDDEITAATLLWSKQIEFWTPLSEIDCLSEKKETVTNEESVAIKDKFNDNANDSDNKNEIRDKDNKKEPVANNKKKENFKIKLKVLADSEESTNKITNKLEEDVEIKVNQKRPWVRYFARIIDYIVFEFLITILLTFIFLLVAPSVIEWFYYNELTYITYLAFSFFIYMSWNFFEALLLSKWGTTIGKWLLGVSLTDSFGNKLTYEDALSRSFQVWIKGMGLGLPIVSIITLIVSYTRLNEEGKTSWDFKGNYVVKHKELKTFCVIIVILIMVSYYWFFYY